MIKKAQLEELRSDYRKLDPCNAVKFASMQGREEQLLSEIKLVADTTLLIEELDKSLLVMKDELVKLETDENYLDI